MTRDERILGLRSQVERHAWRVASRTGLRGLISIDDLRSAGWIGAIEAVDAYDGRAVVPLAAFADRRIAGAMYDYLRSIDPLSRGARKAVKSGAASDPFAERVSGSDLRDMTYRGLERVRARIDCEILLRAVELPAREVEMLREYYFAEESLEQIGAKHGINGSRVSQCLRAAREKLRAAA